MKTYIKIWKFVYLVIAFFSHIYDKQATDSTGTHTQGKAHCYHIKATMKALRSNVHVRK